MKITKSFNSRSKIIKLIFLVIILLAAIARSSYGTQLDSFANDEPFHIVAGTYYVQTGDYRLNPEHPPLSKLWVGLWNKNNLKLRLLKTLNDKREERKWLQEIMYFENDDQLSQKHSRWAMYGFHFIFGLMIALLVWNIFGFRWAALSIIWLALEPTISAHQPLVLTDLPLSFALILSALTAAKLMLTWKWKWVVALGASIGVALAIKHSALPGIMAILLLSLIFSTAPFFKKRLKTALNRLGKLAISGVVALTVLWASYGFQYHTSSNSQDNFNRSLELKIADLNLGFSKAVIEFMDGSHLFPKAYVWGLADTVRAGIEGRGGKYHMFFGKIVEGRPSRFYFSGTIISKIPLALLGIMLLSFYVLIREAWLRYYHNNPSINKQQWLAILFLSSYIFTHLIVLAMGRTMYGGIRHALPVVAGLGILSGVLVFLKIPRLGKYTSLIPASLLAVTLIMTIGEKRIYEYYNEIVGGTENAYKYFSDEGGYLGQRFYETKAFFDRPNIDEKEPISAWAWYMREEWESEKLNFDTDAVKDIHDDSNEEGIMKGYYLIHMENYVKWPNWDPNDIKDLKTIKRIGNINIAYGEFKDPKNWAYSMSNKVLKYIREEKNPDWKLVAKRLQKVTQTLDWATTSFVILGNAYVRTGEKDKAIEAYKKAKVNFDIKDPYQKALTAQIKLIESSDTLANIENLRPASYE